MASPALFLATAIAQPQADDQPGHAIPTGIEARPLPPGLSSADQYGSSLALNDDGTLLAVGAFGYDTKGNWQAGRTDVFERKAGDWQHVRQLTAPVPTADGFFGGTVAWGPNHLAVGAQGMDAEDRPDTGIVFLYEINELLDGSTEPQVMAPPEGVEEGSFGGSISMDGDRMAIGDRGVGNVYLYRTQEDTWHLRATLGRDGPGPSAALGATGTLALDGDVLAAGDVGYSSAAPGAGGAFIYQYNEDNDTWTHTQTLTAPTPERNGGFGRIALDNTTLAIGEPGHPHLDTGHLHIYNTNTTNPTTNTTTWTHQQTFRPERPRANLGHHVAVHNNTILAGAPREPANMRGGGEDRDTGAIYWYHQPPDPNDPTWTQTARLQAPVPNPETVSIGGYFGRSVALAHNRAAAGSLTVATHPETTDPTWNDTNPDLNGTGRITVFGPDPDRDFLATTAEHANGTPPHNPDADNDGLLDGHEVVRWLSDPHDPDTDNDTLTDGTEAWTTKTQTRDPDTDGDTFSDALETHGLILHNQPILAPSDPNDHASLPAPLAPINLPLLLTHRRGDISPTPPIDQPHHWPPYAQHQHNQLPKAHP